MGAYIWLYLACTTSSSSSTSWETLTKRIFVQRKFNVESRANQPSTQKSTRAFSPSSALGSALLVLIEPHYKSDYKNGRKQQWRWREHEKKSIRVCGENAAAVNGSCAARTWKLQGTFCYTSY